MDRLIRQMRSAYIAPRSGTRSSVTQSPSGGFDVASHDGTEDPVIDSTGLGFFVVGHPVLGSLPMDPTEDAWQLG